MNGGRKAEREGVAHHDDIRHSGESRNDAGDWTFRVWEALSERRPTGVGAATRGQRDNASCKQQFRLE